MNLFQYFYKTFKFINNLNKIYFKYKNKIIVKFSKCKQKILKLKPKPKLKPKIETRVWYYFRRHSSVVLTQE